MSATGFTTGCCAIAAVGSAEWWRDIVGRRNHESRAGAVRVRVFPKRRWQVSRWAMNPTPVRPACSSTASIDIGATAAAHPRIPVRHGAQGSGNGLPDELVIEHVPPTPSRGDR
jgi:hypothetical protein